MAETGEWVRAGVDGSWGSPLCGMMLSDALLRLGKRGRVKGRTSFCSRMELGQGTPGCNGRRLRLTHKAEDAIQRSWPSRLRRLERTLPRSPGSEARGVRWRMANRMRLARGVWCGVGWDGRRRRSDHAAEELCRAMVAQTPTGEDAGSSHVHRVIPLARCHLPERGFLPLLSLRYG